MSDELKNITENVMKKIHLGEVKMKPKIYFIAGSGLTFLGTVAAIFFSIFLIGLTRFTLRTHWGPGMEYKFDRMLLDFPWWILIFAIISLWAGIWLIRKYDFSYKTKPIILVIGFVLATIAAGWMIDMVGFNERLMHRGPMRGIMNHYFQDRNFEPPINWQR